MKKIMLAAAVSMILSESIGQDTNGTDFYFGPKFSEVTTWGLEDLRDRMNEEGIRPISTTGSGIGALAMVDFGRFDLSLDFTGFWLTNNERPPDLSLVLNSYTFDLVAGYNVLGESRRVQFGPVAGLGLQVTQLIAETSDNIITTGQFFDGDQNMYFDQPNLGIIVSAGLRFSGSLSATESVLCVTQLNYFGRINEYDWSIPAFPVDRLSGLHFSLGIVFRLRNE